MNQASRQTDSQTYKQTERQSDRLTDIVRYIDQWTDKLDRLSDTQIFYAPLHTQLHMVGDKIEHLTLDNGSIRALTRREPQIDESLRRFLLKLSKSTVEPL